MAATPIVTCKNLSKRFGAIVALDGIDLTLDQPCVFGVVGPDGAGKTTLLRVLIGLLEFQADRAEVLGYDIVREPYSIRERLGYVPQAFGLYPDLSVMHNLEFFADVHGIAREEFRRRADELLAIAGLENFRSRLAGALSGGMKQKLAITCALIHKPQLLVLDEPTNGVDVIARGEVWEILRQLQDVAVVISTGYLDEAGRCDEIIYLYAGRIWVRGTPAEVCSSYPYRTYRLVGSGVETGTATIQKAPWQVRTQTVGGSLLVETTLESAQVSAALHEMGVQDVGVESLPPTLEQVFTRLTHEVQAHDRLSSRG
jgi:drug efflux transport system ATP-binding protein